MYIYIFTHSCIGDISCKLSSQHMQNLPTLEAVLFRLRQQLDSQKPDRWGRWLLGWLKKDTVRTTRWILYCRKHCAPVSDHICWEFSSGDWVWQRCSNHAGALWYQVRIPVVHLAPWTLDVDNESSWIWSGWRSLCLFVVEVQIKTSKLACSVLRLEGDHGVIYPSVSKHGNMLHDFPWFSH